MIQINPAQPSDVPLLQRLNDEVFIDNHQYDSDLDLNWARSEKGHKYFTELVRNPENCCFIAQEDNVTVGYVAAEPKEFSYRKSKYLEIDNMGVIPHYRSRGVGTQLLQACLTWARAHDYQKVFVNAYFANTGAIAFYKRSGFSEIDVSLEQVL